jgi:Fe-S-cluster containining protein
LRLRGITLQKVNHCLGCIGKTDNECCVDVYLLLNPNEVNLFENHPVFKKVEDGAIFYTTQGCPYFQRNSCQIHHNKPLYCKYYPIFITGKPFIDDYCTIQSDHKLTTSIKKEIKELQRIYSIYRPDWFWKDVKRELQLDVEDMG